MAGGNKGMCDQSKQHGGRTDRDVDFRGCKGHLLRGSSIFGDKERSVGARAWPVDHSCMPPAARGDAIAIAMAALRCLPAWERALQATRRDNIGPSLPRFTLHFHGSPLEHHRLGFHPSDLNDWVLSRF